MDLDINRVFRSALKSKCKLYRKFVYWFCKHYFYCDIHPNRNIHESVVFAHNGLGIVINEDVIIGENVHIQHHVTIGSNGRGCPTICGGASIGCYAIIIGPVIVGANAVIGAGAVVTKDVQNYATVIGNPAHLLK